MSNSFLTGFEEVSTIGYTENGAMTFTSTLNHNLDFFALASAKRGDIGGAISLFAEAYNEDPRLAILNLFYCRDVRGGQGERNIFRQCLYRIDQKFLSNKEFLSLIPEYGRWDDLLTLIYHFSKDKKIIDVVIEIIRQQIQEDMQSDHPSLCAKWIPLANSVSNAERKQIAHIITSQLKCSDREWRKNIVYLRKKIYLVEQSLTERDYSSVPYEKIPSRANAKYRKVFLRRDHDRYSAFLLAVSKGEAKINASCIYPYEIIANIRQIITGDSRGYFSFREHLQNNEDISSEIIHSLCETWKALPAFDSKRNILAVVDVSGSMFQNISNGTNAMAVDVSTSLGIYTAEHNTGLFKDHYISFSAFPKLIKLNPESSLVEKLKYIWETEVGYDTNFERVFKLILETMKRNKLPKEECPEVILAISDMEFNVASENKTNFESIKKMYSDAGYEVPQVVFWNVMSRKRNVPVRRDENGVVLVSGLSPIILKFISDGKIDPEKFMTNVLFSKRYKPIREVLGYTE